MHPEKKSGPNEKTVLCAFWVEFREGQMVMARACGGMYCWLYCSTVMLHTVHMNFWHVHWLYSRSILNYTILSLTVFQRVLQMDADEIQHEFIYIDKAGFNLTKANWRGRKIIDHRAIINVPGQLGGNITLCAATTQDGVLLRHGHTYIVTAGNQMHQIQYIVIWDNVSFHHAALVQNWFQHHPQFTVLYLPLYSPFLNPAWRWKVYDQVRSPSFRPWMTAVTQLTP